MWSPLSAEVLPNTPVLVLASASVFVSHAYQTDGVQFIRLPPGWAADSIKVPKMQFFICLKGHIEVTATDGKMRTFGPGDTVLMEDGDGKGHRTRVKGDTECVAVVIPVD